MCYAKRNKKLYFLKNQLLIIYKDFSMIVRNGPIRGTFHESNYKLIKFFNSKDGNFI